jgi:hypothetical protein
MGVVAALLALALTGVTPAVSCRDAAGAAPAAAGDAQIGPLTVMLARSTPYERRDAFDRRGWKLPVTLRGGEMATLMAPRGVGLIFLPDMRPRRALTFVACSGSGLTGWPGGIVVDRRRCATLQVGLVRRRVPLGASC